ATSVKKMLSTTTLEEAEKEDVPAEDGEDVINARIEEEMRLRGRLPNVSFFAFTATPKNKTLELFGTQLPDGSFESFSLYTMRQAIEEKFILDVLQNYTTFKVYFSLLKKIKDDPRYDKKKATYLLRSYADLHEHAIDEKTELMLEHFWTQVRHRIDDRAKAMIVTRSRLHAVRYKLAFDRYIRGQGYSFRALVAFSGTVRDPDSGQEFTESGMNGFPESQTAEAFKQNDYRILIVANKFQTGFDQPLLHTMYVDKKLGGVHAVQTLSRLNRTHPDKEDTMVLDFANEAEEIRKSFQPYYEATLLTEQTDPNKLYDFERMLNDYHIFGRSDVDSFASVYFSKKGKQEKIHAILNPVIDRYLGRDEDERYDFKDHLVSYVRLFAFLSQIITFTDADLEKLYQFSRHLLQKLPVPRDKLPVEITENINMDSYRIQQTSSGAIMLMGEDGELQPISELGTGRSSEEELAPLSEIVHYMNEHYGTEFTDVDKVKYFAEDMERRLTGNDALVMASNPDINSRENFRLAFNEFFSDTLEGMIDSNFEIYKKVVDDEEFGELFRAVMFDRTYQRLVGEVS
ncbi:MAG: type I restriction endonuclease subunit R, partial [Euryarchaeota archaeon]|nr:type I restriction endonuclease subunit R [Euryarchaeota archaeon]